jgi:hypothetical protein
MPTAMLLLLQAAAASVGGEGAQPKPVSGPVLPEPPPRREIELDVAQAGRSACRAADSGDIVVCADREGADRYRLAQ